MNKRITSLILCFVMVFAMLAAAVPALAAGSVDLKVTADKTEASPGDTITFTITLGPVSDMGSMQMDLVIPEGLTYVANSGKLADGLKETLGFDAADWTDATINVEGKNRINGGASAADYSSDKDTVLATFQCTVNDDASGTLEVGLDNLEFYSCQTWENHTAEYQVIKASVKVTVPHTHVYDQEVATAEHLKTPATCTAAAVYYKSCTCGENGEETFTSGSALGHDYTKKVENNTYLKTAASNCTEYNVYWYACSRCDANAKDDAAATDKYYASTTAGNHSFTEKIEDAEHYVAGTGTDCLSVKQYYYACAYCDQIGTATWDSTTYGAHTEGTEWKFDENNHWHICTVEGCGVVIESSEEAHTPDHTGHATEEYAIKCTKCGYVIEAQLGHTHVFDKEVATDDYKATDATCTAKATYYKSCACGENGTETFEYGELAAHNPASGWTSDASGHWHACQTANCTEKCDFATHTPDHTGHATEEYAIKCTECGYVIEAQLGHTHVFDKEVATDAYKASDATCTAKATYYKSCACGEKGTATFEYGELADHNWTPATCTAPKTCSVCQATEGDPLGHTEGTEWKSDKDNHWHTCTVAGCGVVIESSKAAHTPDREAATETDPIKCTECGYEIAPALGMSDYILEMPVMVGVKLTGDEKPGKETFKFEIYDLGVEDAEFEILNDTVVAENLTFDENGVAFIEGMLKIKVTGSAQLFNLTEGFKVRMVKGSAKGWTYATEQWNVTPVIFEGTTDADFNIGFDVREIVDGVESEIPANGMSFSVSYEAVTEPGTPKTGDSSNMLLWAALLLAGGLGTFGTVAYSKKRKEDAE